MERLTIPFKKSILLFCLLALIVQASFSQNKPTMFDQVYAQIKLKNFFRARDLFDSSKNDIDAEKQNIILIFLNNAFNKPLESNQKITTFFRSKSALPDSLILKIYRVQEDNFVKLHDYAQAKRLVLKIINEYKQQLSIDEKNDLENNLKIWTALAAVNPQKTIINSDTRIKIERDKAGLKNLPVRTNDTSTNFIFDTGANLSTVSLSTAKRLAMQIIPTNIDVDAITGISIKANLAVCKKLSLGNISIENAVFLVFADSALHFPQLNYQINGILGYPVIESLKEVQLTQNDYFIVPKVETKNEGLSNLAIDGLSPLIDIEGQHFTFDTGAEQTILYAPYYEEYKEKFDQQYSTTKIRMGGAGGTTEYDGFKIDPVFRVMGKSISLKNVSLLKTPINKETVYGNVGQDLIRQFGKMTINFDRMYIRFD